MLNNNEQNSLQRKPERQKKLRLAPLLLLLGGVVIMGTLLMVAWQVYTTNSQSSSAGRTATQKQGGSGSQDAPFWDNYPAIYWKTLRTQVAQGFHMSEQQMQSAVNVTKDPEDGKHGMLGKPLSDLATAHGISQDQLHTIEVNAVQKAHAILVSQGG
ncbi:hypothetical protein [Ktedonobacter robiniae]|uniref:Uncharacterized protein n=1 Tax=Ktedonobacter robiniae TaxID=2778365 RepID=A0ABQ3UT22_9CHLR|nr:hypothetical protein [Ktedonobacter robiniae]GHO55742.1 hypothetical protein KSB_42170 [Ktedonobacter robiniae]